MRRGGCGAIVLGRGHCGNGKAAAGGTEGPALRLVRLYRKACSVCRARPLPFSEATDWQVLSDTRVLRGASITSTSLQAPLPFLGIFATLALSTGIDATRFASEPAPIGEHALCQPGVPSHCITLSAASFLRAKFRRLSGRRRLAIFAPAGALPFFANERSKVHLGALSVEARG